MVVAVSLGLDQDRAVRDSVVAGAPDRLEDGNWVHAVYDQGGHVVPGCPDCEILEARRLAERGGHRVAVVLEQEDDREVPRTRKRDTLVEGADRRRAIAERGERHVGRSTQPGGKSLTSGDRDAAADDGAGQDPCRLVGEVHRAAPTACKAGGQAEDLGKSPVDGVSDRLGHDRRCQRIEVSRGVVRDELCQDVVVGSVGGGELVARLEAERHPDGHGFLADARVKRAMDQIRVID